MKSIAQVFQQKQKQEKRNLYARKLGMQRRKFAFLRFFIGLFLVVFYNVISYNLVYSQELNYLDAPRARYGLFSGLSFNKHISEINGLTNVPQCCPNFTDGDGHTFSLGLSVSFPLSSYIAIGGRVGLYTSNAGFANRINTTLMADTVRLNGFYEHKLDTYFKSVSLTPLLSFSFLKGLNISLGVQAEYMLKGIFEQSEKVIDNSTYFLDGSQSRNITSGTIGNLKDFQANIFTGVSYSLSLNQKKTFVITPEIYYSRTTFPVIKDVAWKSKSFGLSLAFEYSPEPTKPLVIAPEPLSVKKDNMRGSISIIGLDDSLNEKVNPVIRIEEFETSTTYPLLNYVFFDEDSNYIPARYNKISSFASSKFAIDSLFGLGNIEVYHNILNIIGKRMQINKLATITLTGCNMGVRNETDNRPLSRRRASEVGSYLEDVWGISTNRIKIEARNLPEKPCYDKSKLGDAENGRVEITSGTPEILAPVVIHDTLLQITPKLIRFKPEVSCEEGLRDWFVEVRQFPDIKKLTNKADTISELDWTVSEDSVLLNKPQNLVKTAINYVLRFRDNRRDSAATPTGVINVNYVSLDQKRKQEVADYKTDRYMLLFSDSTDYILDYNKIEFLNSVRGNISKDSKVTVTSQTDTLGSADKNLEISTKRANAVARALRQKQSVASGLGKVTDTFDNELPEGRFYSRNAKIVVETPIK